MSAKEDVFDFNFGPIGRTAASVQNDTFNLASLAHHETLNALMGATDRDEFVEWLWHDLFKPAFYWPLKRSDQDFQWHHIPGLGPFAPGLKGMAHATGTTGQHVLSGGNHKFAIAENEFLSEQVEQVNLGKKGQFIQMSLAVEPGPTTALLRAVIADAFVAVVTRDVARVLRNRLSERPPSFEHIRFCFDTISATSDIASNIWQQVGRLYHAEIRDGVFSMYHVTPISGQAHRAFSTKIKVDLTGRIPSPQSQIDNTFSLAEFLIVYQDSRTIIMIVPQPAIYSPNIAKMKRWVYRIARCKLAALNAIVVNETGTDYLRAAFEKQVDLREVPLQTHQPKGQRWKSRPLDIVLARPMELLEAAKRGHRLCRLCGSPFQSNLPPDARELAGGGESSLFSSEFTDAQYVGPGNDVCPLCRIYVLNSPGAKAGTKKRKVLRGAFALIMPSSHFAMGDTEATPVERPPLDVGGRFEKPLQRVTITTQEFTIFQQMSRRIIAQLWREIEPEAPLPLPYLGAILLTHREDDRIGRLLPKLRLLFTEVYLRAYPFVMPVRPAVEVALDVAMGDDKHFTKHTYLKARPMTVPIHPTAYFTVLLNNGYQIQLSKEFFSEVEMLQQQYALAREARNRHAYHLIQAGKARKPRGEGAKMQEKLRRTWLSSVASGSDPITATYESALVTAPAGYSAQDFAFTVANMYRAALGSKPTDGAGTWEKYQHVKQSVQSAMEKHLMLARLLHLFVSQKEMSDD